MLAHEKTRSYPLKLIQWTLDKKTSLQHHKDMLRLNRQFIGIFDNRCPICGIAISRHQAQSKTTCSGWKCLIAYRKMQRDARRKHDEQFVRCYRRSLVRATRLRNTSAQVLDVQAPKTYRVIITPVNERLIVPLTRRRRYRFVKRLIRLVEGTLQGAQREPRLLEDNQQSLPILAIACANCEGKCCVRGGTGAHLDKDAIRRFVSQHTEADARTIIEAYVLHLPFSTYRNSCVFHSANGCSLPRSMRSATCLNTVCGGLVELRLRIEHDGETRFFLAAANKNRVIRGMFAD